MYVDSEKYIIRMNWSQITTLLVQLINGATIQAEKLAKWLSSSDTELPLFYFLHIPKNVTNC